MIPAALIAILAISRLGAIHAVVFGGFSAPSLAQRIDACKPTAILTASCGIEGAKGPLGYKALVTNALDKSSHIPDRVIIYQRNQWPWTSLKNDRGERHWQALVRRARERGIKAGAVPVRSSDPIYIIYTSGTTGTPKGVVREAGGHAVGLNLSIRYVFGIKGPGDIMFCASDIGWVVGHSYIIYGPLLAGAATVLFEGKPVGTPNAGTFWRILKEYRVNTLFTAPTALRAIRREDPENHFFHEAGEHKGLSSLRALFLAGERSEPSIITMYQKLLTRYCEPSAVVIDNWWSSESGSPISAISLLPAAGQRFQATEPYTPLPIKTGAAGKPMPGWDVRVVDDSGFEITRGQMGNIVLAMPLAPTGFRTLWGDEERFYRGYMKRFNGHWIDTGDAGMIDGDGYIQYDPTFPFFPHQAPSRNTYLSSVMSRTDDIINVAAHRFSTGSIEQVLTSHPQIAESCVVGIPDALKGHLPFAFITLSTPQHPTSPVPSVELVADLQARVREQIGGIAALGGVVQGQGMIPKTRSGKTLRRVLRELVENAVEGHFDKQVSVPATVEDAGVVEVVREKIRLYFERGGGKDRHLAKL